MRHHSLLHALAPRVHFGPQTAKRHEAKLVQAAAAQNGSLGDWLALNEELNGRVPFDTGAVLLQECGLPETPACAG